MRYVIPIMLLVLVVACQPAETSEAAPETTDVEENLDTEPEMVEETKPKKTSKGIGFFAGLVDLSYHVDYDVTTTTQGQTMSNTMGQYVDVPDKYRIDVTAQNIETRTIIDGNMFYSCQNFNGWTCTEIAGAETATESRDIQEKVAEDPEQYNFVELPPRTVAGVRTECFSVELTQANMEYCFSEEGVPLYMHTVGETYDSTMVATSYSTRVSASDFDLPAQPGETAGLGDYQDLIDQYT